jgi:serine kinase of HPr protein (carbohydrate metabolism regulator)
VKIDDLIRLTNAKVVAGKTCENYEIQKAFSSDLMSDVLTLNADHVLLLTGLSNVQILRTAEMADIEIVVLGRNKKATPEMIDVANSIGVVLLESPYSVFRLSGILYENGLAPVY